MLWNNLNVECQYLEGIFWNANNYNSYFESNKVQFGCVRGMIEEIEVIFLVGKSKKEEKVKKKNQSTFAL